MREDTSADVQKNNIGEQSGEHGTCFAGLDRVGALQCEQSSSHLHDHSSVHVRLLFPGHDDPMNERAIIAALLNEAERYSQSGDLARAGKRYRAALKRAHQAEDAARLQ